MTQRISNQPASSLPLPESFSGLNGRATGRPWLSRTRISMRRSAWFKRSWHSRDSVTPCSNNSRLRSSGSSPCSSSRTIRSSSSSDDSKVLGLAVLIDFHKALASALIYLTYRNSLLLFGEGRGTRAWDAYQNTPSVCSLASELPRHSGPHPTLSQWERAKNVLRTFTTPVTVCVRA